MYDARYGPHIIVADVSPYGQNIGNKRMIATALPKAQTA
jgi:hypothetical protein